MDSLLPNPKMCEQSLNHECVPSSLGYDPLERVNVHRVLGLTVWLREGIFPARKSQVEKKDSEEQEETFLGAAAGLREENGGRESPLAVGCGWRVSERVLSVKAEKAGCHLL